jgi:hypothetical protein
VIDFLPERRECGWYVIGDHDILMVVLLLADEIAAVAMFTEGEVEIAADSAFPVAFPVVVLFHAICY